MDSISLRPICAEDERFLYDVYASTRREELAPVPWSSEQKDAFLQMQFDAQHQYYMSNYSDADFHVILCNEQPVGRLYVHRRPDEIRVVDISLLPEHCHRGIGGLMFRQLIAEADRSGLPLTIHVERFNPARHWYERLGFRTIDDGEVYLFMERRASPKD